MLTLKPVTFRDACAFVAKFHRHNKPPRGHKFSIGIENSKGVCGVVMVGRPVARAFDNGFTAEINRTCTDGQFNGNSMLYGAAVRACKAMGYLRVITYTQSNETGASLKASGFVKVRDISARKSWVDSSGPASRHIKRDPVGNGNVDRILWEIKFGK